MKRTLFSVAIAGLLGFSAASSFAYDIFMQIPNLPGESLDLKHQGWIDVYSFSHGMSKPEGGSQNHAEFSILKRLDKTSPRLNLNVNKGTAFPTITVEFQKSTGETPVVFYKVILENAVVTSVSSSGSVSGDVVTESISLNYERINWVYYQVDPYGKVGSAVSNYWDLSINKGG